MKSESSSFFFLYRFWTGFGANVLNFAPLSYATVSQSSAACWTGDAVFIVMCTMWEESNQPEISILHVSSVHGVRRASRSHGSINSRRTRAETTQSNFVSGLHAEQGARHSFVLVFDSWVSRWSCTVWSSLWKRFSVIHMSTQSLYSQLFYVLFFLYLLSCSLWKTLSERWSRFAV